MRVRIVTVILAVALAIWAGGIAVAQVQEDVPQEGIPQEGIQPENVRQEGILDFVSPTPEFDELESELPLRGALDDPMLQESTGSLSSLPPAATPRTWLEKVRRLPFDARTREIAGASAGLLTLLIVGWMFASAAFRRRARRSYRRSPRSSGGSRVRGLDQVVASVQLGRAKRAGRRSPMHESIARRPR